MSAEDTTPPEDLPYVSPDELTAAAIESKINPSLNGNITEQKLSPEYIYKTNQKVEDFGDTPFAPIPKTRNTLAPPSPFKPRKLSKEDAGFNPKSKKDLDYCKHYPTDPKCLDTKGMSFCEQNPSDPRCHDEVNVYKDLGFFQEEVRYIFDPKERAKQVEEKTSTKPVSTLYESTRDNTQLDSGNVIRTECRCKDGTKRMGWLDVRSGQKDCSTCQDTKFNNPNIYKNYKTKRKTPNFSGKSVPLRKQVGVSHFGDVNMKGCQTGNAEQTLEQRNKISTLNNVTNIDTKDNVGGAAISVPQNNHGLPISLYDNLKTNVYGL